MREKTIERIKALGLNVKDFEPKKQTDSERITELEEQNEMLTECIIELANIIYS